MIIIVHRHNKSDAIKDAHNLVEKLRAVVTPGDLRVTHSGLTIYANDIQIEFRCGRIENLAGLRPDYYEADFWDALNFLAQSAIKCGGKALRNLDDIVAIVKKTEMRNYETCKGCPYYYGEIDQCMFGDEDIPDNLEKKCKKGE